MAVAYDAVGPSATGNYNAGTVNIFSMTCSGTNRLLTVGVAVGLGDNTTTTSVTYNSVSMTSAGKIFSNNQNNGYVELFYLVNPATGANTVTVSCNQTKDLGAGAVSFTGVDQTTPLSNIVTTYGFSTAISLNVTSATGNMVIDAACCGASFVSSGQTLRWVRNENTTSGAGNGAQSTATGAATVNMSYTVSSDWWAIIAANINAVSGGAVNVATVAWLTA